MEDGKNNNKKPGIKPIHLEVLSMVRIKPLCATDLGHSLKKDHNYLLHVSGRMRSLGLVTLEEESKDRRRKLLTPTRSGLIILGVSKAKEEQKKTMLKKLNDEVEDGLRKLGIFVAWGP
jgi:DNA-binding MarR family transcriptional regulator